MANVLNYLLKKIPGVSGINKKLRSTTLMRFYRTFSKRTLSTHRSPTSLTFQISIRLLADEVEAVPGIDLRVEQQFALLEKFAKYYPEFNWPNAHSEKWRFHLIKNFREADALISLALREFTPKRVIEIGSDLAPP